MNRDLLLAHFDRISDAPDAIPRLRRFVLDLAVRGKLVEQDPKDEPASEFLARIHLEKVNLVGVKIPNKTLFHSAKTLEAPFSIPYGWQWVRLGQLVQSMTNGIYKPSHFYADDGVLCLRMYNIREGRINFCNGKRIRVSTEELQRYRLVKGDLLVNRVNSRELVGKAAPIPECQEPLIFESKNIRIRLIEAEVLPHYSNLLFQTAFYRSILEGNAKQACGQATVSQPQLSELPLPLPPIAEQRRIVAKVDELMTLCDRLEVVRHERESRRDRLATASVHHLSNGASAGVFREHVNFSLINLTVLTTRPDQIKQLRQTILNFAVRGQLFTPDPNDEPASHLLERIQTEKELLVKEEAIKKDKKTWEGLPKQPPYQLPSAWIWTHLQDVFEISRGGSPRPAGDPRYFGGTIPWITVGEITKDGDKYLSSTATGLTEEGATRSRFIESGDLLLTNSGATLGVPKISLIRACMNDGVAVLRQFHSVPLNDFAYLYLHSQTDAFRKINQGMGQPNLNTPIIAGWFFPLPPLAEQRRIVTKVEELMAVCDQLEESLSDTETACSHLLEAVLHDALASPTTSRQQDERAHQLA